MNISLLNSPLLSWDRILDSKKCKKEVSKIIQPICLQNMQSNPWFKQYRTIFEQSNDYMKHKMKMMMLSCEKTKMMLKNKQQK
jgi:hypothetical protein